MHFYDQYENLVSEKNRLIEHLTDSLGIDAFQQLKSEYYNDALEKTVTNRQRESDVEIVGDEVVHLADQVFQEPTSEIGRAALFLPFKLLNIQKTETVWFNVSIIWLFTSFFYLILLFNPVGATQRMLVL
jgi:hypothetical protein